MMHSIDSTLQAQRHDVAEHVFSRGTGLAMDHAARMKSRVPLASRSES
jgi:hypothetical protein